MGMEADGTRIYGTVIFIHPKKRFITVERDTPRGGKIRESIFIGIRRGSRS